MGGPDSKGPDSKPPGAGYALVIAGHGFKPGQSGNPGGRPKASLTMALMIRQRTNDGAELVEFALAVLRGGWPEDLTDPRPTGEDGRPVPKRVPPPTDDKSRRWAAEWLSDRGFGKPIQDVDVHLGAAGLTPEVAALVSALQLSPHERRARIADLKARSLAPPSTQRDPDAEHD